MIIYKPERCLVPIKLWCNDENYFEQGAKDQIENCASLPFAFHHVALMPDGHQGYGMPIGGVCATAGVISPNMVGVDIGCGMIACKLPIKRDQLETDTLKKIMGRIREVVPVGFKRHDTKHDIAIPDSNCEIVIRQFESAKTQIGTLGGGNHFIEIQKDESDFVWIMIHSGSRNLGLTVAKYYNDIAKTMNEKYFSSVDKKLDLAFLPFDSGEARAYFSEMNYCVDFALANRKLMLDFILNIFRGFFTISPDNEYINIAHNYASIEHHFDKNVIVHRKGATKATPGLIGIIPGSQGASSYIVRGLGNAESFNSCSHGAGRKMGRKEASRTLNLDEQKKILDDQGIIHGLRNSRDLDEAPGAYKNIQEVMNNQTDLVEVVHALSPLAVIKGD